MYTSAKLSFRGRGYKSCFVGKEGYRVRIARVKSLCNSKCLVFVKWLIVHPL